MEKFIKKIAETCNIKKLKTNPWQKNSFGNFLPNPQGGFWATGAGKTNSEKDKKTFKNFKNNSKLY